MTELELWTKFAVAVIRSRHAGDSMSGVSYDAVQVADKLLKEAKTRFDLN